MNATIEVDEKFFAEKAALAQALDWHDLAEIDEPAGLFRVARMELKRFKERLFELIGENRSLAARLDVIHGALQEDQEKKAEWRAAGDAPK